MQNSATRCCGVLLLESNNILNYNNGMSATKEQRLYFIVLSSSRNYEREGTLTAYLCRFLSCLSFRVLDLPIAS